MNLDALEPEERKEAIKVLASLGLSQADVSRLQQRLPKAKPQVKDKQEEYILRRETICLLCKTKTACFFKMSQSGKHSLKSSKLILSSELLNNDLKIKTTKHVVLTCPNCLQQLRKLEKDDLIQLLKEARGLKALQ